MIGTIENQGPALDTPSVKWKIYIFGRHGVYDLAWLHNYELSWFYRFTMHLFFGFDFERVEEKKK